MMVLVGAVTGLLAATGAWLVIQGLRGVPMTDRPPRRMSSTRQALWRAGAVAASTLVLWAATGWPAVGAVAGGVVAVVPMLVSARRERAASLARTEALASWAEMLRDTIVSHAGLHEAINVSAPVAPEVIRPAVHRLAVRAEHGSLSAALHRFADEVDDPVADLIVAALVIASERQAQRLPQLLSGIATAARDMAQMRLRVETGRARTYASSRSMVVITFGVAVGLFVFSRQFMEPYDTAAGQGVLLCVGLLFVGALWSLVQLGRPADAPRILAGAAHVPSVERGR
jgi:hypothetical protein